MKTNHLINSSKPEVIQVENQQQLAYCHAIRSACFLPTEPWAEEWDNKDFTFATHYLAFLNGYPAGTMRLELVPPIGNFEIHASRVAALPTIGERNRYMVLDAMFETARHYCETIGASLVSTEVKSPKLKRYLTGRKGFELSDREKQVFGGDVYEVLVLRLSPGDMAARKVA